MLVSLKTLFAETWRTTIDSAGPQGNAKYVTETMYTSELFFSRGATDMDDVGQFLGRLELSIRMPDRARKPATEREIYVVFGLFIQSRNPRI
jgi:hypothetical protein